MKTQFIVGSMALHAAIFIAMGLNDESSGEKARAGKSSPEYSATIMEIAREPSSPDSAQPERDVISEQPQNNEPVTDVVAVEDDALGDRDKSDKLSELPIENLPDSSRKRAADIQENAVLEVEKEPAAKQPVVEEQPQTEAPRQELVMQETAIEDRSPADNQSSETQPFPEVPPQALSAGIQQAALEAKEGDGQNYDSLGGSGITDSEWANYKETVFSAIHAQKVYPKQARIRRAEGVVTVKFVVNKQGKIESFRLLRRAKSKHLNSSTEKLFVGLQLPAPVASLHSKFPSTLTVPIKYSLN